MNKALIGSIAITVSVFLGSCGGGAGGGGQIELKVENAYKPANIELPDLSGDDEAKAVAAYVKDGVDPLRVVKFRVTVSGDDMEDGLVTEADADAEQIQVLEIPPGPRDVLIEAFNGLDEVIRRRLIEDVIIKAGVVTPIQTSLNTIPIILNFRNNAVVLSKYFRIEGFGEPEAAISILSKSQDNELNLCLNAAGDEMTVSPDISSGLFEHIPEGHAIGRQDIVLTDTTNGESSSKAITLVDADDRPGFRFVTAGSQGKLVTVGTGFSGLPDNHYPLVLRSLVDQ